MLGHHVHLVLVDPPETVSGELRRQDETGVWVYSGWAEQAKVRFYPMRRVVNIEDNGYVHR